MPKLGLSIGQGKKTKPPSIILYEDNFIGWGYEGALFTQRQWFSSGLGSTVIYGLDGESSLIQETNASGRHTMVHFDCAKDMYPLYDNGFMYAGGGQTVYAGIYGHGLFTSSSYRAAGYPPQFSHPVNNIDGNGWVRVRPPAPRTIQQGKTLLVSFRLKLNETTALFSSTSNSFRIGLFGSTGDLVNLDNVGLSDARFNAYTGYMFSIGLDHRIYKRIPNSSATLISAVTPYTKLFQTTPMSFSTTIATLDVELKVHHNSSGQTVVSSLVTSPNGSVTASSASYVDTAGTLSFDTLCLFSIANAMASFEVSDVVARIQ
jgi:hypothetical protein